MQRDASRTRWLTSTGGSTLRNEIIGDLDAEFHPVTDGAEDVLLSDFASGIQKSFAGILGKSTKSLIDKFFSAYMPGALNQSKVRDIFRDKYGIGSGRQDTVLLMAVQGLPATRLVSEAEAKLFWSGVTKEYAQANGIALGSSAVRSAKVAVAIDSRTLGALTKRTHDFHLEIHDVYARHLGESSGAADADIAELKLTMQGSNRSLISGITSVELSTQAAPSLCSMSVRCDCTILSGVGHYRIYLQCTMVSVKERSKCSQQRSWSAVTVLSIARPSACFMSWCSYKESLSSYSLFCLPIGVAQLPISGLYQGHKADSYILGQ